MWDYISWLTNWLSDPNNTENLLLIFLIIGTVLTPIIIYNLDRGRIPKLKFSRFIKVNSSEWGLLFAGQNRTGFFIKVVNTNRRSEGKADECQGFVTVGNKTYRTVWEYGYAGTSIGRKHYCLYSP
jgi:hypothetical protein